MALDIAALQANYQPINFGAPKTATGNKKKGKGGTATSLISEIGGTGGALGGAAAGAALGSVVPVFGTAVGGLAGALIGGFGGGTVGRGIENKVRDDQDFFGEGGSARAALTEGAISGVMGAGPLRLLKAGKGLATAGKQAATGGNLTDALVGGTARTAEPLKTSMAGKVEAFGNKQLAKNWGTLDSPTRRMTDPAKTIPQLFDIGVTKKADADRIASGFTGTDGLVNKAVIKAVGEGTPVSIASVADELPGVIINRNLSGLPQEKTATAFINAQLTKLGATPSTANIMSTVKRLEKQARDLEGAGGNYKRADPTRGDLADVYRDVAKNLEGAVYKGGGVDAKLSSVLTPELRQNLLNLHPNNPQWTKYVDDKVMGAKSVKELRGAQSPFVKARQMVDNVADNEFSASGQMVNNAGGIREALANGVANFVKQPMQQAAGVAAKKAAPLLPGGTGATAGLAGALTAPTAAGIIRNTTLGNAGEAMIAPAPVDALSPEEAVQEANMAALEEGFANPEPEVPVDDSANDPFNPANAQASVRQIMANGGSIKDVKEYLAIVSTLGELGGGNSDISADTGKSLAMSANGESTLNQLEQLYSQAGGGKGRIGGRIANVMGSAGMNEGAATYNAVSASTVTQLAKALAGGGQVSDADAAALIKSLPLVTDSPEEARVKFASLRARLQAARGNALQYGGGGSSSDLLSALNQ